MIQFVKSKKLCRSKVVVLKTKHSRKSTTFGLKFAVSRKLKNMENSDPPKSGGGGEGGV